MTVLSNIAKIETDIANLKIIVTLDKRMMSDRGLKIKDVQEALEKDVRSVR